MGNASGRCNQSHWSREKELIIYWSHALLSIAQLPLSNTAASVAIPLFSNFLISAFSHRPSHLLFFKTTPCQTWFFHTSEHESFLPFSCVVAVNNRKKWECCCVKIHRGFRSSALLLHYNRTGNGWLLPKAEARICISASMVTPMCFLRQWGYMGAS